MNFGHLDVRPALGRSDAGPATDAGLATATVVITVLTVGEFVYVIALVRRIVVKNEAVRSNNTSNIPYVGWASRCAIVSHVASRHPRIRFASDGPRHSTSPEEGPSDVASNFSVVSVAGVPQLTLPVVLVQTGSYLYQGYYYGDVEFPIGPAVSSVIGQFLELSASANTMNGAPLPTPSHVSVSVYGGTGVAAQVTRGTRWQSTSAVHANATAEASTTSTTALNRALVEHDPSISTPSTVAQPLQSREPRSRGSRCVECL